MHRKRRRIDTENDESDIPKKLQISDHSRTTETQLFKPTKKPRDDTENVSSEDTEPASKKSRVNSPPIEECNEYPASGLKSSLHGTSYQLKILMLFLHHAVEKGYSFALATEMDAAEKFDDVVFQYKEADGKLVYQFLQAKHKQDQNKVISVNDLLTEKDGEFSLQKYFVSFRKIQKNPMFKNQELKYFTICTNINFEESLGNSFEPVDVEILNFEPGRSQCLRLKLDQFFKKNELISKLHKSSECNKLAKKLAQYVKDGEVIDFKDSLFKFYHCALRKYIIVSENNQDDERKHVSAKFHDSFVDNNSPDLLKKFRKIFYEAYLDISKIQVLENEFWQNMKTVKLKMSRSFEKFFKLDENPQLTNCEKLAEEFAKEMRVAKSNVVEVKKKNNIIKENLHKLAGHVFIKKDAEENSYYFSSAFLNNDSQLPGNVETFKAKLKAELQNTDATFLENKKYKFKISKFRTCEEGRLHSEPHLPCDQVCEEEIKNFFNKVVFAINQPSETELDEIIEKKLKTSFNVKDGNFPYSSLLKYTLDWMKDKKGRFLTHQDGKKFLKEIRQKISSLVVHGSSSEYCAEIKNFDIEFTNVLPELQSFLISTKEQIFNLISSSETTRLSAIKVIQFLKTTMTEDNFISLHLHTTLLIQDRVIDAFNSEMSNNLLIIECGIPEEKHKWKLYHELSSIMKFQPNKKLILITYENDTLAEQFKQEVSRHNKYTEKIDEKNRLIDLTKDSQKKLLKKGRIIFQEGEIGVILGTFLPDKLSKDLLGKAIEGEVLFSLIKYKEIKIGKTPKDEKYDTVHDYFITRSFSRCVSFGKEFQKNKSKFFVIDKNQRIAELHAQTTKDIVIISNTDENFKECCNKNKMNNIHWLKEIDNKLIWQQSRGNVSKLKELVDTQENDKTEYKPNNITDLSDKIVLISAEPGMGKSTVLSHLATNTSSAPSLLWIIKCNLVDYCFKFSKWKKSFKNQFNAEEVVKFLYEIAEFQFLNGCKDESEKLQKKKMIIDSLSIENHGKVNLKEDQLLKKEDMFEIELFTWFHNQGNIALLLDGCDEISPHFKDQVLGFIEIVKNNMAKIWMTMRPLNIQTEAENKFGTFSYSLEPFTLEDQEKFLEKFWMKKLQIAALDKQRSKLYIDQLLNMFSQRTSDLQRSFVSVPLQIYMIAEIFSAPFKEFYESGNLELSEKEKLELCEKLDVNSLYEKFSLQKYREEQRKEDINYDLNRHKIQYFENDEEQYRKFLKVHRILAVYTTLEDEMEKLPSKNIDKKITHSINQLTQRKIKTGIIDKITSNKPNFVHQTFAEYFTAVYLWKKFKTTESDKFQEFIDKIIIGSLINKDKIQICAFLRSKAKQDLESNIDFPDAKNKLDTLKMKFCDEEPKNNSLKDDNTSEDQKSEQCDDTQQKRSSQKSSEKPSPKIAPCKSLSILFGIIETALQTSQVSIPRNFRNLDDGDQYELLLMCAEQGYGELAKALTLEKKIDKAFLQDYLKNHRWRNNILMISIQNGHLNIAELLAEFHDIISWRDGYLETFFSAIIEGNHLNVLKYLSQTTIFNIGKPYDDGYDQNLLLFYASGCVTTSHIIKFLINQTDINIIDEFIDSSRWNMVLYQLIFNLFKFDDETLELAIKKGINFSNVLNIFLYSLARRPFNYYPFTNAPGFLKKMEILLKNGVGYNCKNIKLNNNFIKVFHLMHYDFDFQTFSLHRECKLTTLHYSKQIYLIYHTLVHMLQNLIMQDNAGIDCLFNIILKLIIIINRDCHDLKNYKIICDGREMYLLPQFEHKSPQVPQLGITQKIPLSFKDYHLQREFFDDENNDINSVQDCLNELHSFIDKFKERPDYFKTYPYCCYDYDYYNTRHFNFIHLNAHEIKNNSIEQRNHTGCLDSESEKKMKQDQFSELGELGEHLLMVVIQLARNYNCDIDTVFKNVSEEVLKLTKLKSKVRESEGKPGKERGLLKTEDILNALEMSRNESYSEVLQNFQSEMSKSGTTSLICNALIDLTYFINEGYLATLQSVALIAEQSKHLFESLKKLDNLYKDLTYAIKIKNFETLQVILEQEQVYKKSIICGQDEKFGSPLHYVACTGDVKMAQILLSHEANPNLRLNETGIPQLLSTFKNPETLEENENLPLDYYSLTPLHLAALNCHNEIVQLLIDAGAKINVITISETICNGNTPLHLSIMQNHLETAKLLLQNGACYDLKNSKNKTPLELAKPGSDVADLLQCIHQLFQAVEECRKYSVCSLLERNDSDSLKAILHAKNSEYQTLLNIAHANKNEEIVDLLNKKSNF